MIKIELNDFNKDDYSLIKSSKTWNVYKKDNTFYKEYKQNENRFITEQRLKKIDENNNSGLCQIRSMIYKNICFNGYIVESALGKSYKDLLQSRGVSLDTLIDMFTNLYLKVKANENRNCYVFSDLATSSNIFWNEETHENTLIDLDGIQVPGFLPSTTAANIDNTVTSPIEMRKLHLVQDFKRQVDIGHIYKPKFFNKQTQSFKTSINDLSLLVLFYAMATGKNFMSAEKFDCANIKNLVSMDLLKSGLSEYDVFYQSVLDTVNLNCENKDVFLDSLYQLRKKYELEIAVTGNPTVKQRKFVLRK